MRAACVMRQVASASRYRVCQRVVNGVPQNGIQATQQRAIATPTRSAWHDDGSHGHRHADEIDGVKESGEKVDQDEEDIQTSHHVLQCWSCDYAQEERTADEFFCKKCEIIQPPQQETSYFDLFGLPEQMSVDKRLLKSAFRSLQKRLHPDFFNEKTDKEQAISADQASLLNHAFTVLSKPHLRAVYLLQRKGFPMDMESGNLDDMELLMEVMETRETLESAGEEEAERIGQKTVQQIREFEVELERALDSNDIDLAKELVIRLQYRMRIASAVEKKLGRVIA